MRGLFIAFLVIGCKVSSQQPTLNDVLLKELGAGYTVTLNEPKTFALAVSRKEQTHSYVVVQISTNKVLLRKHNILSDVTWQDESHIKETSKAGVFRKDGSPANTITIINVYDYLENKK